MTDYRGFPVAAKGALPQWVIIAALAAGVVAGVLAGCAPRAGGAGQVTEPYTHTRAEGEVQTRETDFKAVPYAEFQMAFGTNAAFPVIVEIPANYVLFKAEGPQMDRRVFWIPEDVESEARSTQSVPHLGYYLVKHTFDVLYDATSKSFQGEESMKEAAKRFERLHFDGFAVLFMELELEGSYIYMAYLAITDKAYFTKEYLEGTFWGEGGGLYGTVLYVGYVPPNGEKTEESDEVWMRFTNSIVSSAASIVP